jgi:leucyl aminopeptidase
LILADGLSYAARFKPAAVVDIATLTGACVVALGNHACGAVTNDAALLGRIRRAGDAVGERVWELPLFAEYHDQIKSDVADMQNVGGRPAGAITAAAFLSKFAGEQHWVHLDIAGTAWADQARPYTPKGATGFGARLLTRFLMDWAEGEA